MANITKKTKVWKKELDRTEKHNLSTAIQLAKKHATAKFKERVDVSIRLGVDPRKSDQVVRGSCILPHGTGKEVRILVFAKGEKVAEAIDAGADYAGGDDLVEKIQGGWLEFDRVIATPDMMAVVGKIGKVLGPRGMMPNPKVGTVTPAVGEMVKTVKLGQVQFKTDKGANVHANVGAASFSEEQLKENIHAVYDSLIKLKPATSKGTYVKGIFLSTTMGPGLRVDEGEFR